MKKVSTPGSNNFPIGRTLTQSAPAALRAGVGRRKRTSGSPAVGKKSGARTTVSRAVLGASGPRANAMGMVVTTSDATEDRVAPLCYGHPFYGTRLHLTP